MAHPDLAAEQAYLDHAYECLEQMRQALLRTVDAAAIGSEGLDIATKKIEAWVDRRLATYERAEQTLCFGRIDVDTVEQSALHRAALGTRRRRRRLSSTGRHPPRVPSTRQRLQSRTA